MNRRHQEKKFCVATQRCVRSVKSVGTQPLRCNALNRLAALIRQLCVGTQILRCYAHWVANVRWNAERRATPPTHAVWSLVCVATKNGQLVILPTHGVRTNATPHGASTINAVWFCVFRWNA
jgi:hypothetical protein